MERTKLCNMQSALTKNIEKNQLYTKLPSLLTYKQFEDCIELCSGALINARLLTDGERQLNTEIEYLCLASIQCHAELDRWSEVLPLVTQLYNGIEDCPASIVEACILLHAKVEDYATCTAIGNIWLRNPNNYNLPAYSSLVELYIAKLLIPLDKWTEIQPFLHNCCPGLTENKRETYLKYVKTIQRLKEQEEVDKIQELAKEDPEDELLTSNSGSNCEQNEASVSSSSQANKAEAVRPKYTLYVKKMTCWLKKNIPIVSLYILRNFSLFAVILYIIFTRANFEMMSWENLSSVMQALVRLWKSMFAPFHIARSQ